MKEIFIIPTTHTQTVNYRSEDIAQVIIQINPDVIFCELPMNWNETKSDDVQQDDQEGYALKIVQEKKNIDIVNVDLPYRNEIAQSLNLYSLESKIESILFPDNPDCLSKTHKKLIQINENIFLPENKIEYTYLISARFKKLVRKKNRIIKRIIEKYQRKNRNDITIEHKLSDYFHNDIRENIIIYNCLQSMRVYNRGVLLIGAEHINIINKLNKSGRGFIKWKVFI